MGLLADAIGGMPDGTAIVSHYNGVDMVYGEDFATYIFAYIFAYGANHEENFVAESFYAVDANDGTVYVYDMVKGVFRFNSLYSWVKWLRISMSAVALVIT